MTNDVIAANDPGDRPMAKLADVKLPEYERRVWRHVFAEDVDWQVALRGDYWTEALQKLAPGDRIECFSAHFDVGFELLVQEVIPLVEHIRFIARPLFPHDLVLPAAPRAEEPRYFMRQGQDRLWEVVDRASGLPVKARIGRAAADSECFTRNQADRDARALVTASAAREGPVGEAAAAALSADDVAAAAPVPEPAVEAAAEPVPEAVAEPAIDEIDDLTGLPVTRPAQDVAAELAALGRATGQQEKETAS